ncbi:MAG: hypothetical protein WCI36_02245 [bacterium]
MSIEDYKYGKVSPIKDVEGNEDISHEKALEATSAIQNETAKRALKAENTKFEGDDVETKEVIKENFETALSAVENDIAVLTKLASDLSENKVRPEKIALSEHTYETQVDDVERRLNSINRLYKEDNFPKILGRLNDAMVMLDSLKINKTRLKMKKQ